MYYLRSRPAVDAIKFTVDKEALKSAAAEEEEVENLNTAAMVCSIDNKDSCVSCGSWSLTIKQK